MAMNNFEICNTLNIDRLPPNGATCIDHRFAMRKPIQGLGDIFCVCESLEYFSVNYKNILEYFTVNHYAGKSIYGSLSE